MGLYSFPLFAYPSNILFVPHRKSTSADYASYIEDIMTSDIPIYTDDFMQKIIDNDDCLKIYGYLLKDHVKVWYDLLTGILEQNSNEHRIEFHFYCNEIGIAYYFLAKRKEDKIVFSIMVGAENDGAYHNVTYEDYNENEYTINELYNKKKKETMRQFAKTSIEKSNVSPDSPSSSYDIYVKYSFDEEKYRIVYNMQNVPFRENPPHLFLM